MTWASKLIKNALYTAYQERDSESSGFWVHKPKKVVAVDDLALVFIEKYDEIEEEIELFKKEYPFLQNSHRKATRQARAFREFYEECKKVSK